MIECNEINVSYTGDLVVEAVSFSIREPAIIGVIGPNGAGKSTLLKAMLAIIPHSGEVLIDGVPAKKKFETSGIRGTKKVRSISRFQSLYKNVCHWERIRVSAFCESLNGKTGLR